MSKLQQKECQNLPGSFMIHLTIVMSCIGIISYIPKTSLQGMSELAWFLYNINMNNDYVSLLLL